MLMTFRKLLWETFKTYSTKLENLSKVRGFLGAYGLPRWNNFCCPLPPSSSQGGCCSVWLQTRHPSDSPFGMLVWQAPSSCLVSCCCDLVFPTFQNSFVESSGHGVTLYHLLPSFVSLEGWHDLITLLWSLVTDIFSGSPGNWPVCQGAAYFLIEAPYTNTLWNICHNSQRTWQSCPSGVIYQM